MKKSTLLCAFTAAACLSLGGAATLAAVSADAEGTLTVSSVVAYHGAAVKGTQDGKTLLSGLRTEAASYAQGVLDITGYNKESVSIKFTPVQDGTVSISILDTTTWWYAGGTQFYAPTAVTAGEQVVIQTESIDTQYSDLQMYVYLESATATTEQSIIIDEIKFGDVSYTPAEYTEETKPTDYLFGDYTKWTGSSNVAIEANDVAIQNENGVKEGIGTVRFTALTADEGSVYVSVPIEGVAADWSNLYVKFAASSGIQLIEAFINEISDGGYICAGVNDNDVWNTTLVATKPDGYTLSTMAVGSYVNAVPSKTALIFRIAFKEEAVAADEYISFAGMAFGAVAPDFATDSHEMIVGDMTATARFNVAKTEAGTEVSYPLKEGTDYNVVQIPVTNWTKAARYLKLTFTSEQDFQMAVYYGYNDVLSPISSYSAGTEYTIYADSAKSASISEGIVSFYLYIDAWGDSLANTVTFTGVEMAELPDVSLLKLNYETETLVFDDYIEVLATKGEDGALSDQIVSGETAVIPGTKVFFRGKATDSVEATETAEYLLPARPEISKLTPTVTETSIAFSEEGYSFKLGDGEWTKEGSFTGLTAGTEYTVTIRKDATAAEFASEELSFTVATSSAEPVDSGSGSGGSGVAVSDGCGSVIASGALFAAAASGVAAVLAMRKKKND